MVQFLHFKRMKRHRIKPDGHCLPRAVFKGIKLLNICPEYITYSGFFQAAIVNIKDNIEKYSGFNTGSVDQAKEALDTYFLEKKYNLQENIIDAAIVSLAEVANCQIKVHYQCADGSFDNHSFVFKTCLLIRNDISHFLIVPHSAVRHCFTNYHN